MDYFDNAMEETNITSSWLFFFILMLANVLVSWAIGRFVGKQLLKLVPEDLVIYRR